MENQNTYIVQQSDVGKSSMTGAVVSTCKCCGHKTKSFPFEPLGRVMQADVGRMLKRSKNGLWYVESIAQWEARKAEEAQTNG
jgi:hypothetical protein